MTACGSYSRRDYLTAWGETKVEIFADAERQCDEHSLGKDALLAVGNRNRREHWEAIFGPVPRNIYLLGDEDLAPLPSDDVH